MPGGKTNTQRIEYLESEAADLSARLDVIDNVVQRIDTLLTKCATAAEGQGSKILIIEERLVLVDLKGTMVALGTLKEEFVAIKKDIENLQSWKADLKKDKEEASRRKWAFGPNIMAALISGVITLLGVGLTYYLNHK